MKSAYSTQQAEYMYHYPRYTPSINETSIEDQKRSVSRVKFCIMRGAAIVLGVFLIISIMINMESQKKLQAVCDEYLAISDAGLINPSVQNGNKAEKICYGKSVNR